MEASGNPLCQLAQLPALQRLPKLRLSDQENLQQFMGVRLQIGEHADLLQHPGGQVLRLVDHQYRTLSLGMGLQQVIVEPIQEHLERRFILGYSDTELLANRLQKLRRGQCGIEYQCNIHLVRQLF